MLHGKSQVDSFTRDEPVLNAFVPGDHGVPGALGAFEGVCRLSTSGVFSFTRCSLELRSPKTSEVVRYEQKVSRRFRAVSGCTIFAARKTGNPTKTGYRNLATNRRWRFDDR
jgi:hypothetical protein